MTESPVSMPPEAEEYLKTYMRRLADEQVSDRSVAILALSHVDHLLAELLRRHFIDDAAQADSLLGHDDQPGAVSALATRARLAFLLGLMNRTFYDDIRALARVRNLAAHQHTPFSFSDPKVREECRGLTTAGFWKKKGDFARKQFATTSSFLVSFLWDQASKLTRCREPKGYDHQRVKANLPEVNQSLQSFLKTL